MAEAVEDIAEGGPTVTPDVVAAKANEILSRRRILVVDEIDRIKDTDWIKESVSIHDTNLGGLDSIKRFVSGADLQFEDTTLGGNFVINPRPQFTRYADTRSVGV